MKSSVFVLRNIAPIKLQKIYDSAKKYLPKLVQRIFYFTTTIFLNLLQWMLGGLIVDKAVKAKGVKVKPALQKFSDIFNPQKLYFHPPRYTGLTLKKEIEAWRQEQIEQLPKESLAEREAMKYRLPPEHLVPAQS